MSMGGIGVYLVYSLYKNLTKNSSSSNYIQNLLGDEEIDVNALLEDSNAQVDPSTGEYADGQLNPQIYDVPDTLGTIITDVNYNNYQELIDNTDKVTIDLNTDENVVEGYGQSNFDYEGLINSEAGEIVQFNNQFITLDIHNVNNFEFWFVINNISCLQGYGSLYAFNIYSATNMQPIAPIQLNTDVIGYQFTDIGVVFVEIIIACEDNYGELLDPIQLSFFLDVGNYTNLGGGFVLQDAIPDEAIELSNTNKVD
tara:strand:+ start:755 stop:1519 length:765 start_codon:yes stop_codon:yes gene_type:complete